MKIRATDKVMSVAPIYADRILSGSKTIELRTRAVHVDEGQRIWLYATSKSPAVETSHQPGLDGLPAGPASRSRHLGLISRAIVGHVTAVGWLAPASPSSFWDEHHASLGVDHGRYLAYFEGRKLAFGLVLRDPVRLARPLGLDEIRSREIWTPPQGGLNTARRLAGMDVR